MKTIDLRQNMMENLKKRDEALANYLKKRKVFIQDKKQILIDIKEAEEIWNATLNQLPNREFK